MANAIKPMLSCLLRRLSERYETIAFLFIAIAKATKPMLFYCDGEGYETIALLFIAMANKALKQMLSCLLRWLTL